LIGLADAAGGGEGGEAFVQGSGADAAAPAQFGERHGAIGKSSGDALVERGGGWRRRIGRLDDLQGEGRPALGKCDGDGGERRRGAMLDGEREVIAIAAQTEIGIAPGVELGLATQGLSGAGVVGAFLA
jgi:hypothetical protein